MEPRLRWGTRFCDHTRFRGRTRFYCRYDISCVLKVMMLTPRIFLLALVFLTPACFAQGPSPTAPAMTVQEKAAMADRVRGEALHAWEGYKKYAWGHDELHPLSKRVNFTVVPVPGADCVLPVPCEVAGVPPATAALGAASTSSHVSGSVLAVRSPA